MIISFTWPSSHHRTGGVVMMYRFANALAARGHRVQMLHAPAWPDRIERPEELAWVDFDTSITHHVADSYSDPRLPAADVVIFNVAFEALPERLGLPVRMAQGHRMLPLNTEAAIFSGGCPVVCVARWLIEVGIEHGAKPDQLWHVPYGLDHRLFAPPPSGTKRPIDVAVLHNGHPSKGWTFGLEALREARRRRPDLRALAFGVYASRDDVDDWIEVWANPDQPTLVREVYGRTAVFVQASLVEGFGLTAVEAMACGAALVTTDNGGSRDYAVHDGTALVVPPADAVALGEAVETLLQDPDRRARLAEAGARHVRQYTWDRSGAILEAYLERYLAAPEEYRLRPGPVPGDPW